MGLVRDLAAAAITDLGPEAAADGAKALVWLQGKSVSAVDALVGIAEHAISNSTLGEHLAHGTIERTLENAKPMLADLVKGGEQNLYDGLARFVAREVVKTVTTRA